MKIVVLAGGLSTERQVALTSGTGVCRALRERGHQAILVDMFLGLESYEGRLEDIFDAPDGLCGDNRVTEEAPDLEAVCRSRKDQGPSLLGKDVLDSEDFLVSNLLLPIGSLVYLLFCVSKWGWGFDKYVAEANKGKGLKFAKWLKPYFQFILPALIVVIFLQGLL